PDLVRRKAQMRTIESPTRRGSVDRDVGQRRTAKIQNDIRRSLRDEANGDRAASGVARHDRQSEVVANAADQLRALRRELARNAWAEDRLVRGERGQRQADGEGDKCRKTIEWGHVETLARARCAEQARRSTFLTMTITVQMLHADALPPRRA